MTMKKKIKECIIVKTRDKMILNIINFPTRKKEINLHWFPRCEWVLNGHLAYRIKSEKENLGDWLALPIYDYMLKRFQLDKNKKVSKTKHLYTIGSLIMMGQQDATIWGSGILNTEPDGMIWDRNKYRTLDPRCVRGPETLRRLKENGIDVSNCKIGDPGVLMPLIYKPKEYAEKREYSVLIHTNLRKEKIENEIEILTDDWQKTIDEIYNSKLIISSTLHGIILAEAYGVPAIMLNKIERNDKFKYDDYYHSTGRYDYPICSSVEEALSLPIPEVPDLSQLQRNLLESFPVDLWEKSEEGKRNLA